MNAYDIAEMKMRLIRSNHPNWTLEPDSLAPRDTVLVRDSDGNVAMTLKKTISAQPRWLAIIPPASGNRKIMRHEDMRSTPAETMTLALRRLQKR